MFFVKKNQFEKSDATVFFSDSLFPPQMKMGNVPWEFLYLIQTANLHVWQAKSLHGMVAQR